MARKASTAYAAGVLVRSIACEIACEVDRTHELLIDLARRSPDPLRRLLLGRASLGGEAEVRRVAQLVAVMGMLVDQVLGRAVVAVGWCTEEQPTLSASNCQDCTTLHPSAGWE